MSDAADGAVMLAHAIAHAAYLDGAEAADYRDIIRQATGGPEADYAPILRADTGVARSYAIRRARELVAQSDAGLTEGDPDKWEIRDNWIGAAREILRELIRDA